MWIVKSAFGLDSQKLNVENILHKDISPSIDVLMYMSRLTQKGMGNKRRKCNTVMINFSTKGGIERMERDGERLHKNEQEKKKTKYRRKVATTIRTLVQEIKGVLKRERARWYV